MSIDSSSNYHQQCVVLILSFAWHCVEILSRAHVSYSSNRSCGGPCGPCAQGPWRPWFKLGDPMAGSSSIDLGISPGEISWSYSWEPAESAVYSSFTLKIFSAGVMW
jgi:hypothetical protein